MDNNNRRVALEYLGNVIGEWAGIDLFSGDILQLPDGKYRVDHRRIYSDYTVLVVVKISEPTVTVIEPQPVQKELI